MNNEIKIMNEKLIRLSKESIRELEDIGLGKMIPKNLNFTINYKAKQRFGHANRVYGKIC